MWQSASVMAKMRANLEWRTLKGTRTSDNRDFAGIGINAHGLLMIITDGSTAGESNGDLARVLVKEMVDWFAAASPAWVLARIAVADAQSDCFPLSRPMESDARKSNPCSLRASRRSR